MNGSELQYLDWLSLSRPGYRLLDMTRIAIPMYRVNADVLLIDRRPVGPIEEFVLKAVAQGFVTLDEIAGVLGLERTLVHETAVGLLRDDCLHSNDNMLGLTAGGRRLLATELRELPSKESVWIGFDRLRWKVVRLPPDLKKPRELDEDGLLEVEAVKSRVRAEDLKVEDIDREVRSLRGRGAKPTVLTVEAVRRRERLYLPAELAVFEARDGGPPKLAVMIDRRPSEEHSAVLEQLGGLAYLGQALDVSAPDPAAALAEDYGPDAARELVAQASSTEDREKARAQRAAQLSAVGEEDDPARPLADPTITSSGVDFIDTYEHRVYLDAALTESKRRLVIVSPWIAGSVVNAGFLEKLRHVLQRGVPVHIGYGMPDRPGERKVLDADQRAEEKLQKMSERFENFTFTKLGNTHSKQLLFDDTHVSGSFNWLSFQGARGREYRHEESTVVRIKRKVDQKYDDLMQRFAAAERKEAERW